MNTRVHIHREQITSSTTTKHFIVMLPFDAQSVVAIRVCSSGISASSASTGHTEVGLLRLIRDCSVLYEKQVRLEDVEVDFAIGFPQLGLEKGFKAVTGNHQRFDRVKFRGYPRALFCKYDGGKVSGGSASYMLTLYFVYTKKTRP